MPQPTFTLQDTAQQPTTWHMAHGTTTWHISHHLFLSLFPSHSLSLCLAAQVLDKVDEIKKEAAVCQEAEEKARVAMTRAEANAAAQAQVRHAAPCESMQTPRRTCATIVATPGCNGCSVNVFLADALL
jgi:hypothetical protein